ncbi:tryptophan synthase alpha chain [Branchiibius hedensis]|uniref:Tryptophan synthase alpha chain n=1 Tax=Branchiibius hedensis TaxID=672460 RepID=A0A2Y8ZP30_9MICO|nr:tryptophan synthase subunit alpha [Branchiibius hedensis]PWJ25307.1 tryptophan synthase alpha chain [Branchiibius hedensis]SSA34121.1 tryptophan synthase, alpha chain [Branchiibius hedensis]
MTHVSEVTTALSAARAEGRAAFIAYLPLGFPTVADSIDAMRAVVAAGADIVEIGLPYSDPLLDGPVIQTAVSKALERGSHVRDVFAAVRAIREAGAAAVVMTSWNLILQYGVARFAEDFAAAGGSGLITPDITPEEAGDWLAAADKYDLDPIFLIAPSTTPERLVLTTQACRGFVYAASVMGVTGARESLGERAAGLVERAKAVTDVPICVGIGVSNAQQAHEAAQFSDGVIVGTALVRPLVDADAEGRSAAEGIRAMVEVAEGLSAGVRR